MAEWSTPVSTPEGNRWLQCVMPCLAEQASLPRAITFSSLPVCATWPGVTDEERNQMCDILARVPQAAALMQVFGGSLILGSARECLIPGTDVDKELRHLAETPAWRSVVGADSILLPDSPYKLEPEISCLQGCTVEYGRTAGGLPVVVESAAATLRGMKTAAAQDLPPERYARTRVAWFERVIGSVTHAHARGLGNGQFIYIQDGYGAARLPAQTTPRRSLLFGCGRLSAPASPQPTPPPLARVPPPCVQGCPRARRASST